MVRRLDVSRPLELGEHLHPDRRDAGGDRDALLDDQVGERLAGQVGAGHHEVGSARHGGVGEPPRVGVEHRHDGQDAIRLPRRQRVGQEHAHRVQERAAVAVHDALGVPGGAARVAHARSRVLVDPLELGRLGSSEQRLVVEGVVARQVEVRRIGSGPVVHHHEVLDPLERRQQRGQQAEQRTVDEDDLVVGVVDDVRQLLREQTDVQGVQHPAGARSGEVELEVPGGVPGERRNARRRRRSRGCRARHRGDGSAPPSRRRSCGYVCRPRRSRSPCGRKAVPPDRTGG